jgi:hypothetical protein
MSRRGGRLIDLLWAAPLGICLTYAAAVYDNPKLGRRLLASVGLPMATPIATFGEASGEGRLMIKKGAEIEFVPFGPRHSYAYAYERGYQRKVLLILTAQPADLDWENGYAEDLIREWSKANQAPFVLIELDHESHPSQLVQSSGAAQFESQSVHTFTGGLRSIEIVFEINDGTRLKGRLQGGDGNCGGRYCDPQMDYTFDVSVLQ